jgi:tetratricopeptide (TPR) repeat protein
VKSCPECGCKLTSGKEKFCPECGHKLAPNGEGRAINMDSTSGDVVGTGFTGTGHITGKEVGYTVQGNVINLQISGDVSREVLDTLQRMTAVPSQLEQVSTVSKDKISAKEDIKTKLQESETAQQQIKNVLEEVNKIEKKAGTEIQEIKAGDLKISRNELSLKEVILKGNEHFYNKEYSKAIECYDKALKINPTDASAQNNKTILLNHLNKQKKEKKKGWFR